MHTMVSKEIVLHPVHSLGGCSACGTPLTIRTGQAYASECLHLLYCDTCQTACAETPDYNDLAQIPVLLAAGQKLAVGNVSGLPETLRRLMALNPQL